MLPSPEEASLLTWRRQIGRAGHERRRSAESPEDQCALYSVSEPELHPHKNLVFKTLNSEDRDISPTVQRGKKNEKENNKSASH